MTIRICAVGDLGVDRYPDRGTAFPGGSAANVAVHARRRGARAGYVGIVGDDAEGGHILAAMRAEEVDVSRVRRTPGPNSRTDVAHDEQGNRVFTAYRPPGARLELDADDLAYLTGATWVHTGHSSFTDPQLPAMSGVAPVAYDFSYQELAIAAPHLPYVTAAAFSRAEASVAECRELIDAVAAAGPRIVAVTRGAAGSVVRKGADLVVQPAVAVRPVDTLGAGDAYLAALLYADAAGLPLAEAAAEAAAYASVVCGHLGAFGHPVPVGGAADRRDMSLRTPGRSTSWQD